MNGHVESPSTDNSVVLLHIGPVIRLPSDRRLRPVPAPFEEPAVVDYPKGPVVDAPKSASSAADPAADQPYDPYDPHDHRHVANPTSFWGTVMHLMLLVAGPSVLTLPSVTVDAGYAVAAILTPCLFCLYVRNARTLVRCEYQLCQAKRVATLSYPQVAYHAFQEGPASVRWLAPWAQWLSYVDFAVVWFGFYCYNYVIASQNLQILFENAFERRVPANAFLELLVVPLALLAFIPKLKFLVPFSCFGSLCNALSLLVVAYFVVCDPSPWRTPPKVGGHLSAVSLFAGTVLVNLNVAGFLIPLRNEMKEPQIFASPCGVLTTAYAPTALLYVCFSLVCALKYGDRIQPSVIDNLPRGHPVAQFGICVSSVAIVCQQPLISHVLHDVVWNQILKGRLRTHHPTIWQNVVRVSLVAVAFVASVAVPNVFLFLSVSGSVGTSIDSLILPALIHTAVMWNVCEDQRSFRLVLVKNMVIVCFAVLLLVTGFVYSINLIVDYYSDHN